MKKALATLATVSLGTSIVCLTPFTAEAQTTNGYLFYNGSSIEYVQLTISGNAVSGKILIDSPAGVTSVMAQLGAAAIRTESYSFTGLKSGSSVTLRLNTHETVVGSFSGKNLVLQVQQSDGSLGQLTLKPASIGTYNKDLALLKKTFNNLKTTAAKQSAVDDALLTVGIDQNWIEKDYATSANNLSTMKNALQQGQDALSQVQQEGQAVINEVQSGNVDWTQYEGYMEAIDTQSFEMSDSNYQQMEQSIGGLANFASSLSDPTTLMYAGLTAIDTNQMTQDIQKYQSDYAVLIKAESLVPNYHPSPAIPSKQWVTNFVKTEQIKAKTFISNLNQVQSLEKQYSGLASQAKALESQVQAAITNSANAAQSKIDNANAHPPASQLVGSINPGRTQGTVNVEITGTRFDPSQESLVYVLVNSPTAIPNVGDAAPSQAILIHNYDDVNVMVNGAPASYIDVYALDSSGKIVMFNEFPIYPSLVSGS